MNWKNLLVSSILIVLLCSLKQVMVFSVGYSNVNVSQAKEMTASNAWIAEGYSIAQIEVPRDYATIQAAIDAANDGDIVFVSSGIYQENIIVEKSLSLVGENKDTTIIEGEKNVISLKANNTKIKGFTVKNGYNGIKMYPWTQGHAISKNIILNNSYGISGHYDCTNVIICDNIITSNNITGIKMLFSHSIINGNLISDNGKGEFQEFSSGMQIWIGVNSKIIYCINNTIFNNTIKNHRIGVWEIRHSEENVFFHNNFINNTRHILTYSINNTWDNGYPFGGNYWSDCDGVDLFSGPYQNKTGRDGIGDTPYVIDENNQDNYPLMKPYPWGCDVNVDGVVDVTDLYLIALAYGVTSSNPKYSLLLDINFDGIIEGRDLYTIAITEK